MATHEKKEQFEYWLAHMNDALEEFLSEMPSALDYSVDSLEALEACLLKEFPSVEGAKTQENSQRLDGYSRYLGEVIRKSIGGIWSISYDDPKNAFYGRPQISEGKGQQSQICPQAYVTTAIARRRGSFLRTLVSNWAQSI